MVGKAKKGLARALIALIVAPTYLALLSIFGFNVIFFGHAFATFGIAHYPWLMAIGIMAMWSFSVVVVICVLLSTRWVFSPDWWRGMWSYAED